MLLLTICSREKVHNEFHISPLVLGLNRSYNIALYFVVLKRYCFSCSRSLATNKPLVPSISITMETGK